MMPEEKPKNEEPKNLQDLVSDRLLDEWIQSADPLVEGDSLKPKGSPDNWDLNEACLRITESIPSVEKETLASNSPTVPSRQSFPYKAIALALSLLVVLSCSIWFLSPKTSIPVAKKDSPSKSNDRKKESQLKDRVPSHGNSVSGNNVAVTKKSSISTAKQYLALKPFQRWKLQKKIDQSALKEELGSWLDAWYNTKPGKKKSLEESFVQNQPLWLPMLREHSNHWKTSSRNRASLQILSQAKDSVALYKLRQARKDPKERQFCNEILFTKLTDTQLAAEIQSCQDCQDLSQLLSHLAERPGSDCTDVILQVAGTKNCSDRILSIKKWNKVHIQRALDQASGRNNARRWASIEFLSIAKTSMVEDVLQQSLASRRNILPAISVLLNRNTKESRALLEKVQRFQNLSAYLLSAEQLARNHSQDQHPYKQINQKVCLSCLNP